MRSPRATHRRHVVPVKSRGGPPPSVGGGRPVIGRLAKSKPETVGTGSAEEEYLRERLSEVEAALHSMKGLNARFAEQIETSSKRDSTQ
mgnify:CR=1 FL=1